ncbi:MAG: cysteine-rich CWC family protein [Undibacterium sp.]|nr:cysteine-rich CWC family protein [Undibacterium sp.]
MSTCERCHQEFSCAMVDNSPHPCWCTTLPKIPMPRTPSGAIDLQAKCLCPDCLPLWITERTSVSSIE